MINHQSPTADADIVIIGGGVAGCWLMHRLRQQKYRAILIERQSLGGVQTIASQGIIHSGLKYALQNPRRMRQLKQTSQHWGLSLKNRRLPMLGDAKLLSADCLLWSGPRRRSRAFAALANALAADRARKLRTDEYPEIFDEDFAGNIYSMETPVIDMPSLMRAISAPHEKFMFQVADCRLHSDGRQVSLEISTEEGEQHRLKPRMCVLAAGAGNAKLLDEAGEGSPVMRTAPLRQLMVHAENLPELHGHYLEPGRGPQLTITTHRNADNQAVWYIGGALAANCRNEAAGVLMLRTSMARLFKDDPLRNARFKMLEFTRAEPVLRNGRGMDGFVEFSKRLSNLVTVWPVKLTLTPSLTPKLMGGLRQRELHPEDDAPAPDLSLPAPPVAAAPWHDFALS